MDEACSERKELAEGGVRAVATTSTVDDWLSRGSHPIVANLSLHVYAMWVYRVEKAGGAAHAPKRARHVDIEFAPHYALHSTHFQRLATEHRVPQFDGFIMPTANKDS